MMLVCTQRTTGVGYQNHEIMEPPGSRQRPDLYEDEDAVTGSYCSRCDMWV